MSPLCILLALKFWILKKLPIYCTSLLWKKLWFFFHRNNFIIIWTACCEIVWRCLPPFCFVLFYGSICHQHAVSSLWVGHFDDKYNFQKMNKSLRLRIRTFLTIHKVGLFRHWNVWIIMGILSPSHLYQVVLAAPSHQIKGMPRII